MLPDVSEMFDVVADFWIPLYLDTGIILMFVVIDIFN